MPCTDCSPHFTLDKSKPCVDCSKRCHEVVDTAEEVSQFRDAFVTVREESAVYHVDNVGNIIAVSRNPIFDDEYVPEEGDYKQAVVYNFAQKEGYLFDPLGNFLVISLLDYVPEGSPEESP